MKVMTGADFAQKWAQRTAAATGDAEKGVMRTETNPMELAAAQKTAMLNGVTEAINSGKWERGLQRVSKQQWQQAFVKKGVPRIQAGVQEAKQKVQQFADEFLPFVARVQSQVKAMDGSTLEGRLQRMMTNARELAQFRRTR